MELYRLTKNMGDMRLNINGYEIAVFSEHMCKFSETLRMIKERDGLDNVITINLCSIVEPQHVDALFSNLYKLNEAKDWIYSDKYTSIVNKLPNKYYLVNVLAIDLLIEYLCIDCIKDYNRDGYGVTDNTMMEFLTGIPYNPMLNIGDYIHRKITCKIVSRMYGYDLRESPLRETYDKSEVNNNDWYRLYKSCIDRSPQPRYLNMPSHVKNVIKQDAVHAAMSSKRARLYIFDILAVAAIPETERVLLWHELIMSIDAAFKKHIRTYIEMYDEKKAESSAD
jgi:hypothetical protein